MRLIFWIAFIACATASSKYGSNIRQPLRSEFATNVDVKPGHDAFRDSNVKPDNDVFVSQFGGASKQHDTAVRDRFHGFLLNDEPHHDEKITVEEPIPNLLSGDLSDLPVPEPYNTSVAKPVLKPLALSKLPVPDHSHDVPLLTQTIVKNALTESNSSATNVTVVQPSQTIPQFNHPVPHVQSPAALELPVPDHSQNVPVLGETIVGDILAPGSSYGVPPEHIILPAAAHYDFEPVPVVQPENYAVTATVIEPKASSQLSAVDHLENVPVLSETIAKHTQPSQQPATVPIYVEPVATPHTSAQQWLSAQQHAQQSQAQPPVAPQASYGSQSPQVQSTDDRHKEEPTAAPLDPPPVVDQSSNHVNEEAPSVPQPKVTNAYVPDLPLPDYTHRILILGYLPTRMPASPAGHEIEHIQPDQVDVKQLPHSPPAYVPLVSYHPTRGQSAHHPNAAVSHESHAEHEHVRVTAISHSHVSPTNPYVPEFSVPEASEYVPLLSDTIVREPWSSSSQKTQSADEFKDEAVGYVEPPPAPQHEPMVDEETHLNAFTYHLATPIPRNDNGDEKLEFEFIAPEYAAPRGRTLSLPTSEDEQESDSYHIATARPRYNTPSYESVGYHDYKFVEPEAPAPPPTREEPNTNEYHHGQPSWWTHSESAARPLSPPQPDIQVDKESDQLIDEDDQYMINTGGPQSMNEKPAVALHDDASAQIWLAPSSFSKHQSTHIAQPSATPIKPHSAEQPKPAVVVQRLPTPRHDDSDAWKSKVNAFTAETDLKLAAPLNPVTWQPVKPKPITVTRKASKPILVTTSPTVISIVTKDFAVGEHDDVDAAIAHILHPKNPRCKEGVFSSIGKCRRQYYKCVNGARQTQFCTQPQFVFSVKENGCVPKVRSEECSVLTTPRVAKVIPITVRPTVRRTISTKNSTNQTTLAPDVLCAARSDGFYRHPTNCSRIIQCFGGEEFEYPPCPNNLAFDESTGSCNYRENVDFCADNSSSNKPISKSSSGFGGTATSGLQECNLERHGTHMRNPTDCSSFYRCVWERRVLMNCPAGTIFNPRLDVCDYPQNVPECQTA